MTKITEHPNYRSDGQYTATELAKFTPEERAELEQEATNRWWQESGRFEFGDVEQSNLLQRAKD